MEVVKWKGAEDEDAFRVAVSRELWALSTGVGPNISSSLFFPGLFGSFFLFVAFVCYFIIE